MRAGLFALLLVVGSVSAALSDERGEKIAGADLELKQARRLSAELVEDVKALRTEVSSFNPDERFIDAQVYFDLRRYEQASLQLASLVEDARFRKDAKYFDAVRMLGVALFNVGNFQGARQQFEALLSAGVEEQVATTHLVEIAARLGNTQDLQKLARGSGGGASAGIMYARGKAHYFTGNFSSAMDLLRQVPIESTDGQRARYLTGACLVALDRMDDAYRTFESLVAGSAGGEETDEIRQMAFLALGRLDYERGNYSKAADFYQRIPHDSPHFDDALYEATNVYIKWARERTDPMERNASLGKAEEMLETLVGITRDPKLSREARVLRGRISMYLEKYDKAEEAYQEVIDLFAATSSELTDIAQSPENVQAFFDAMIKGGSGGQELTLLVSQEVVDFMRTQPRLGRMVDMMVDVAAQRLELEGARKIYGELEFSLSQPGARDLFPGYADAWIKSLEIENRLLAADALLLDVEHSTAEGRLGEAELSRLAQLKRERAALEKKLANAPKTMGGYRTRNRQFAQQVRELSKDVDGQLLRIAAIQEQISAMQKLLKEVKYKGSNMLQVKDEGELIKEIQVEGAKLAQLQRETEAFRAEVEKIMLVAEVGNPSEASEQDVKAALWRQHGEEAGFFIDAAGTLPADERAAIERSNAMRREILDMLEAVRQQQRLIDEKADVQIKSFKRVLAGEKNTLDVRERELKAAEGTASSLARDVGPGLFLKAKEEMVMAVVEADLGLVDLTWKRKQDETNQIEAIQKERGDLADRLRGELSAITGGEEEEEKK